jgi:hypothetical protein
MIAARPYVRAIASASSRSAHAWDAHTLTTCPGIHLASPSERAPIVVFRQQSVVSRRFAAACARASLAFARQNAMTPLT